MLFPSIFHFHFLQEGVGIISCILNSNMHFHFLKEGVGIISCTYNTNFHFHFLQEGVGIMETPNYPLPFPASASCRWRVSPGHTRRVGLYLQTICFIKKSNDIVARYLIISPLKVLLLLPRLSLPSDCSASLTITRFSYFSNSDFCFGSCRRIYDLASKNLISSK